MITDKNLTRALQLLLEETFVKHHGMFTNKGTSLFETLEAISAEEASVVRGRDAETIAGHVYHATFYLVVVQNYLRNINRDHADWDQSWVVKAVTDTQWTQLKADLRAEYDRVMAYLDEVDDWGQEDLLEGVLGILAHNAFHLGAIRELSSI
jgi:hypothetical protein